MATVTICSDFGAPQNKVCHCFHCLFKFIYLPWSDGSVCEWVKVAQSCPTLCNPMDYTVHGILQARILEWVAFPFSRDLLNPRIKPRSAALQAVSLPAEPLGKPKNTGMGSLSLLQGIFPTQELNQGLLHCGQILYLLSYQGSPVFTFGIRLILVS